MTGALRAPARPAAAQAAAASQGDVLTLVLSSLDDDKAEDVVAIDLRGKSAIADHMVIATGRSARQVTAIAEKLAERFKERFHRAARAEGRALGDWVLIDCGDVIVHVFRPEVRAFYQMEKMWMDPADLRARAAAAPRAMAASPADA
jgi:ribosome-associated protein